MTNYKWNTFVDCAGCRFQEQCTASTVCQWPCGFIASQDFPITYHHNRKCTWTIQVDHHFYIQLRFLYFDIFEETSRDCVTDYVELIDGGLTSQNDVTLGKYCNTFFPPSFSYSSWNRMIVNFFTDTQTAKSGFLAKYDMKIYELPTDLTWESNSTGERVTT